MRESFRVLLGSRPREARGAPALRSLRELASTQCARLTLDDQGSVRIENSGRNDLGDGMFDLLLIVRDAQERGSWAA